MLKGVAFELDGPGGVRETRTDANGRYQFSGWAPGTYTLTVSPTKQYTFPHSTTKVKVTKRNAIP